MDGKDGEGAGPGGRTGTLQGDLCWLPAGHHEPTLLALAPCLCSLSRGKALPGLLRVSSQAASFLGCRWPPLLALQDSWALCLHLPSAGRASCGPGGGGHWLRLQGGWGQAWSQTSGHSVPALQSASQKPCSRGHHWKTGHGALSLS